MPIEMQAKILRVIEEKEITRIGGRKPIPVNFALIAATNRDLEDLMGKGLFRADLYYRINTFVLKIPPLRERKEDILPLAQYLARCAEGQSIPKPITLSEEVLQAFMNYDWPGNVRELKNLINFAINNLGPEERIIQLTHLPLSFMKKRTYSPYPFPLSYKKALLQKQKDIIQEALRITSGNKVAAAKLLGISRSVLYQKLQL
jgi:transcriptional regulator with PAS, ATPase and Fis domain